VTESEGWLAALVGTTLVMWTASTIRHATTVAPAGITSTRAATGV
jgi:hypothetical protein